MADGIIPEGVEDDSGQVATHSLDLAAAEALAAARHDPRGRAAAAAFLTSYRRFVDAQAAYVHEDRAPAARANRLKRTSDLLKISMQWTITMIGLAVVIAVGSMFWSALSSGAVIVNDFDAPASLAAQGRTGREIASSMLDALLRMREATRALARTHQIEGAWTDAIELKVPEVGISLGQLDDFLRRMFGHDVHIGGSLTLDDDGTRCLTARGDHVVARTFCGPAGSLDRLTQQAAEYIFGLAQPLLYADYLGQAGRPADAIAFLQEAFPRASDRQRAGLANLWGDMLLAEARLPEAIDRYRLALRIDPHDWRAWNNLVGALAPVEGDEAAFLAGQAMRKAAAAAAFGSGPSAVDEMNVAQLTLDPEAVIKGGLAAGELDSEQGVEFDDSSWIAEQKAVEHDWEGVEEYLADSSPADPSTAFDTMNLAGLKAIEANQPEAALRALQQAYALWQVKPSLQGFLPDFPCTMAYADALAGQPKRASALFDATGRHLVRCRALQADALDLAGDWPAAQSAFREAEAAAPDLAYAYEREAGARLRHGERQNAIALLLLACRRSPHWADPLKELGDAYAQAGNRPKALQYYREAAYFAPNWTALQKERQGLRP